MKEKLRYCVTYISEDDGAVWAVLHSSQLVLLPFSLVSKYGSVKIGTIR